jgi:hypothetical protein
MFQQLCTAQFFRRTSFVLLFLALFATYPPISGWLADIATAHVPTGPDHDDSVAQVQAKLVDWVQVYAKFGVALMAFALINGAAWLALNVVPVLPDWATSFYKEPRADYPAVPGFKGTFLRELTGLQRLTVFLVVWGFQLAAIGLSVYAAFRIQ